jgi:hypothetical protein
MSELAHGHVEEVREIASEDGPQHLSAPRRREEFARGREDHG